MLGGHLIYLGAILCRKSTQNIGAGFLNTPMLVAHDIGKALEKM